jgi:hypothetical protein
MSKKNEITLVKGEDGVYSEEDKPYFHSPIIRESKKKKEYKSDNVEEFFAGIDAGLDFVEGMNKRIKRMLKIRQ